MEFERLEAGCTQSFVRWNHRSRIDNAFKLFAVLAKLRDRYGRFYLLSDAPLPTSLAPGLVRSLHNVAAGYDGQAYYMYVVGPDRRDRAHRVPQCAPARVPMPALGTV